MSTTSKSRIGRVTLAALITLLVAMSAFTVLYLSAQNEARALDASEWQYVRQALDDFVAAQYQYDAVGGESGFITDAATLKTQIDSNGDNTYLGAGDDAANAPVLVDVLVGQATWIPATSSRSNWNTTTLETASVNEIAGRVDAHEAAGFSTDVVVYCATGHTESAAAGGLAAVSYAGGLGGSTPPKVLGLKWGRYGWNTGTKTYSNTNAMVAPGMSGGPYANGTNAECGGVTPNSEMVRCVAEWALDSTGGNVGNGSNPPLTSLQTVDLRPATISTTVDGGTGITPLNVPIDTVFTNAGLNNLDPSGSKKIFVNRTQHLSGMVATGAEMLGYDSTFLQWGLPNYNNAEDEKFTAGAGYPVVSTPVDFTAPVISNVVATPTADGATITWNTDEPATTRLKWDTSSGAPYGNDDNDTILKTSHSVTITGQSAGSTIYYEVSAYDGQANSDVESEASVQVARTINHTDDDVYYMTWYDSDSTFGWLGSWIVVGNLSTDAVDVEVRIDGEIKGNNASLAGGDTWFQIYPGEMAPLIEVVCFGCKAGSDDIVVSQRSIFKGTFDEYIAVEWDNLSDNWYFPWYDNDPMSGMGGNWIVIANPDTTQASVTVNVDGSDLTGSPFDVPAGSVVPIAINANTQVVTGGPVKVEAAGTQKLLVTQRVVYLTSFNEVVGLAIPTP